MWIQTEIYLQSKGKFHLITEELRHPRQQPHHHERRLSTKTGGWQGICLCEHRNHGGSRRLVVTIQGE